MATKQVDLSRIAKKVIAYNSKMYEIAKYLENAGPDAPQLDLTNQYLELYIDKPAFLRMVNIAMLENFDSFGVFLGLDERFNDKITVSVLGLDARQEILPDHCGTSANKDAGVDGEEDWPPPYGQGDERMPATNTSNNWFKVDDPARMNVLLNYYFHQPDPKTT